MSQIISAPTTYTAGSMMMAPQIGVPGMMGNAMPTTQYVSAAPMGGVVMEAGGVPTTTNVTTTYVEGGETLVGAPVIAAPQMGIPTLQTVPSMVAYPTTTGPFTFYAEYDAKPTETKKDVTVSKKVTKKKGKRCGCC